MATLTILNGPVISSGQSLSNVLDITAGTLGVTRIMCPPDWTQESGEYGVATPISFLWSPDNVTFYDVYDMKTGTELLIPIVPNALYILPRDVWDAGYIKFRSGPSHKPVIQAATRTFKCSME